MCSQAYTHVYGSGEETKKSTKAGGFVFHCGLIENGPHEHMFEQEMLLNPAFNVVIHVWRSETIA